MDKPVNCFVAYFDLLGFKSFHKSKGTLGTFLYYNKKIRSRSNISAAGAATGIFENGEFVFTPVKNSKSLNLLLISDSIIFFSNDNSFSSFESIVSAAISILSIGLGNEDPPVRGAIGYGDLIWNINDTVLIGSALIDAYLGESVQDWSGAMLTDKCKDYCLSCGYISNLNDNLSSFPSHIRMRSNLNIKDVLVKYRVPIKNTNILTNWIFPNKKIDTYSINWFNNSSESELDNLFDVNNKNDVKRKKRNTKKFFKFIMGE